LRYRRSVSCDGVCLTAPPLGAESQRSPPWLCTLRQLLLAPTAAALPDARRWRPSDATLSWRWDEKERRLVVKGFGRDLDPPAVAREARDNTTRKKAAGSAAAATDGDEPLSPEASPTLSRGAIRKMPKSSPFR
jgi:hypothetical protein